MNVKSVIILILKINPFNSFISATKRVLQLSIENMDRGKV